MRTRTMPLGFSLLALTALVIAGPAAATSGDARDLAQGATDSAAVATVITRFHDALAAGDSVTALSLLTDDVVILESGGQESKTQYRNGHLRSDMGFAQAVKSERRAPSVRVEGNAAWASSTSTTQGEYNGRPVNSSGAELMVLVRMPDGWRIAAIHWSSRARRGS